MELFRIHSKGLNVKSMKDICSKLIVYFDKGRSAAFIKTMDMQQTSPRTRDETFSAGFFRCCHSMHQFIHGIKFSSPFLA